MTRKKREKKSGQSSHYLAKGLKEEGEEVEEETWREHILQVDDEEDEDDKDEDDKDEDGDEDDDEREGMKLHSAFFPLFKHKASGWFERIEREQIEGKERKN